MAEELNNNSFPLGFGGTGGHDDEPGDEGPSFNLTVTDAFKQPSASIEILDGGDELDMSQVAQNGSQLDTMADFARLLVNSQLPSRGRVNN